MSDHDESALSAAIDQALASRAGSLPQIASRYYQLNGKGYLKQCPFCKDNGQTFGVRPAAGGHWYWGCHRTSCEVHFDALKSNKTGDTLGFIMVHERCDRSKATDHLLAWTGIHNPREDWEREKQERDADKKKKRTAAQKAANKTTPPPALSKSAFAGTFHAPAPPPVNPASDEPLPEAAAEDNVILFDPAEVESEAPDAPEPAFSLTDGPDEDPPPDMEKTVWQDIWERLSLSNGDREILKRKRGFTSESIDRGGFRSSTRDNRTRLAPILTAWPLSLLLKEGIASKDAESGELKIAAQLCGLGLAQRGGAKTEDKWDWTNPILIPYFGKDGQVTSIRPHKGGLSGKRFMREHGYEAAFRNTNTRSRPYANRSLWDARRDKWEKKCVIAEAEFKAHALDQFRIPAVGLPGIQMPRNQQFLDELVDMLRTAGIREVIVVFDNEDKSHKADPWSRYEAEVYARYCCHALRAEGFLASYGELPDDWRIDGKADWDGALTLGKKYADFEAVLDKARWYTGQTELFGKHEKDRVIHCKLNRLIYQPAILTGGDEEEELARLILKTPMPWRMAFRVREMAQELRDTRGCYYVVKPPAAAFIRPYLEYKTEIEELLKETPHDDLERIAELEAAKAAVNHILNGRPEVLSDFTISCDFQVRDQAGVVHKLLRFRNKHGQMSDYVTGSPKQLSTSSQFREFAMGIGNYNPKIGDKQLQDLMIDLGTFSAWREIRELATIGHDKESGLWITGDCAFTPDGNVIFADSHNIIWHDGIGYRIDPSDLRSFAHVEPPKFFQALGKEPSSVLTEILDDPAKEEMTVAGILIQLAADLVATFGDSAGLLLLGGMLGYSIAPELLATYHGQPGIWMHGRGGAGKSETSRFCMQLYGFDIGYRTFMLSGGTTSVAIDRVLAQYSNWPLHMDEFRADEADKNRISSLRGPFNRQAKQKGMMEQSNRTRAVEPATSPLVTGEGVTNDSATLSRYVSVILAAGNRLGTPERQSVRYKRMLADSMQYHRVIRWVMMRRKWYASEVMKKLDPFLSAPDVVGAISLDRLRLTYGTAWACFMTLFEHLDGIFCCESNGPIEGQKEIDQDDLDLIHDRAAQFRIFTIDYARNATADVVSINFVVKFWDSVMTDFQRPGNNVHRFIKFSYCEINPETNRVTESASTQPGRGLYPCVIACASPLYAEYEQSCRQRGHTPELSLGNIRLESQNERYWVPGPKPRTPEETSAASKSVNRSHRMYFDKKQYPVWVLRLDLMAPAMRQLFEGQFAQEEEAELTL